MFNKYFSYILFCLSILNSSNVLMGESKIIVTGWLLPPMSRVEPNSWLGDDPVLGRLICPPVTRINLKKEASESLFFDHIEEFQSGESWNWKFTPKKGIYWWSGQAVDESHWNEFFQANLAKIIAEKGHGQWKIPSYSIQIAQGEIFIKWAEKTEFAPYVFNGTPFWRKNNKANHDFQFECAGVYRPHAFSEGLLSLQPTPGYLVARKDLEFHSKKDMKGHAGRFIHFIWPDAHPVNLDKRPPHKPAECSSYIDTGWLSLVWWKNRGATASKSVRFALTEMIPRGTFLRSGSGFWGELQSSLIPRSHPAYDNKLLVRPYDVEKAKQSIKSSNFSFDETRQKFVENRSKNQLQIKLANLGGRESVSIVDKAIVDSLKIAGVDAKYVDSLDKADGVIAGLYISMPSLDFTTQVSLPPNRKDKIKTNFATKELRQILNFHNLELTKESPSWRFLSEVHSELYQIEPATVLLNHQVCLESNLTTNRSNVDQSDPDWFRHLIM